MQKRTRSRFIFCCGLVLTALLMVTTRPAAAAIDVVMVTQLPSTSTAEQPLIDFLRTMGANITLERLTSVYDTLDATKLARLNSADLVVVNDVNSGNLDDGSETTQWNGVTAPLITFTSFMVRGGTGGNLRWDWLNSNGRTDNVPITKIQVTNASDPAYAGLNVVNGQHIQIYNTPTTTTWVNNTFAGNNGIQIAMTTPTANVGPLIARWNPGGTFHSGTTQAPGGKRVYFSTAPTSQPNTYSGAFSNLNTTGTTILRNIIRDMIDAPDVVMVTQIPLTSPTIELPMRTFFENWGGNPLIEAIPQQYRTLDATKIARLNAADLIFVGEEDSGQFDDSQTEIAQWNGLTAPLITTSAFFVRGSATSGNSRWEWVSNELRQDNVAFDEIIVTSAADPIFAGLNVTNGQTVKIYQTPTTISYTRNLMADTNGTRIGATEAGLITTGTIIARWTNTAATFHTGAFRNNPETPGGPRAYFASSASGIGNLNTTGTLMLRNLMRSMNQAVPVELSNFAIE